jgi:hypothetical protein
MPTIDCIKNDFAEAIINHCEEKSCKLKLVGLNNYVILKGEKVREKICSERKICDCIIFTLGGEYVVIGIIELKSRTVHASEIEEQLTNGLEVALDILKKCNDEHLKLDVYPIVLSKARSSSELRMIASKRIRVGGKKYDIIPKKCGLSFTESISSFK